MISRAVGAQQDVPIGEGFDPLVRDFVLPPMYEILCLCCARATRDALDNLMILTVLPFEVFGHLLHQHDAVAQCCRRRAEGGRRGDLRG